MIRRMARGDGYLKITNVKVPYFYIITQTLERDCGNECSKNCSCSVGAGEESKRKIMLNESLGKPKLEDLPLYSYETLANATDEFHPKNKLGEGGFGAVYKGELSGEQAVAVKRLSNSSSQGINEFMNEVALISKLQHGNLVRILGCCVERAEKMLISFWMLFGRIRLSSSSACC